MLTRHSSALHSKAKQGVLTFCPERQVRGAGRRKGSKATPTLTLKVDGWAHRLACQLRLPEGKAGWRSGVGGGVDYQSACSACEEPGRERTSSAAPADIPQLQQAIL